MEKLDNSPRIFIGLGSNLGDSAETLLAAWQQLDEDPQISCVQISSPYVCAPVDMYSQHWFTNAVGELRTTLSPHELLRKLLDTETILGRVRGGESFGYQDRVIDLDLLYYGDLDLDEPDLDLPHPHIDKRLFVLTPLCEIAGDYVDVRMGKTVKELEERLIKQIEDGREKKQPITKSSWEES